MDTKHEWMKYLITHPVNVCWIEYIAHVHYVHERDSAVIYCTYFDSNLYLYLNQQHKNKLNLVMGVCPFSMDKTYKKTNIKNLF